MTEKKTKVVIEFPPGEVRSVEADGIILIALSETAVHEMESISLINGKFNLCSLLTAQKQTIPGVVRELDNYIKEQFSEGAAITTLDELMEKFTHEHS